MADKLAEQVDSRWLIDGEVLCKARRESKLSQAQVGLICGWTRAYQCQLENNRVRPVRHQTVLKLLAVFPQLTA